MKKNYWLVGLLVMGMVAFQGCDELGIGSGTGAGNGGGDNSGEPDLGGTMEQLAPDAQKTRLQEVGLEFVNEIKAGDHENLVDVIGYIDENLDYDIDTTYVGKIERLLKETYEGDDDWYGSPVEAVRSLMAISYNAARSGAKLAQNTTDIWTTTLKAGMPDVYGRFTPNQETEEWEWDSSVTDRLEVSFTDDHDQKWVATLKGSKETTQAKVTLRGKWDNHYEYVDGPDDGATSIDKNDDYYEFVIDVPKEVTFAVTCNNTSVIDLTLNSSVAFEGNFNSDGEYRYQYIWSEYTYGGYWGWEYDESIGEYVQVWVDEYTEGRYDWYYTGDDYGKEVYDFKVDYTNLNAEAKLKVNAYEETFKTDVTKQGMAASASVKINGKQMLKAEGALKADIDAALEEGENAYNEEKDLDEIKVDALKEFSMFVDIMGKVQVVGKCDKFDDLFEAWVDVEEAEDAEDFTKYERNVKQANKAYSITIHYDNTETVQARVEAEAYENVPEWDPSYTDCDARPVIVFTADESRHNFEDYFTESSFSDLVEAVSDLYEDFGEMLDGYFEEEYDNITPGGGYYE